MEGLNRSEKWTNVNWSKDGGWTRKDSKGRRMNGGRGMTARSEIRKNEEGDGTRKKDKWKRMGRRGRRMEGKREKGKKDMKG